MWIAPERIKNICKNLELRNILVYDRLSHIQPFEQTIIGPEKNSKSPPTPFNWWRCSMWRLASLWRNVCLRGKVFPIMMMIYKIHCIDVWRDPMHVLFCAQPEHKSVILMLERMNHYNLNPVLQNSTKYCLKYESLDETWKPHWFVKLNCNFSWRTVWNKFAIISEQGGGRQGELLVMDKPFL